MFTVIRHTVQGVDVHVCPLPVCFPSVNWVPCAAVAVEWSTARYMTQMLVNPMLDASYYSRLPRTGAEINSSYGHELRRLWALLLW